MNFSEQPVTISVQGDRQPPLSPTQQPTQQPLSLSEGGSDGDRGQPYLELENIDKTFGQYVALRNIYLDVYPGEFICLLGPSGCGKTTLLRIIAGLEEQTSGRVIQAGKDVSRLPAAKRDFGIVFQSYALFPNLTAAQNIAYGLENAKKSKQEIKARVEELLHLVGLAGLEQKYPAQMSGGQQQRVALARALALSPGLLLLDEPLSALDAKVREKLRTEISQLQKRLEITTVMVTHDQSEALAMADRIVVMDNGYIAQVGTPRTVYQHPNTPFVANFIGGMNFLQGEMISPDQVRCGNIVLDISHHEITPEQPVKVAIRPEDIRLLNQENLQDSPLPNVLTVEVRTIEFQGSGYLVSLRPDGDYRELITAHISVHEARNLDLSLHASLRVQLPPELIQVFPSS
jgi:iron(III) transport system ATP-binding protein